MLKRVIPLMKQNWKMILVVLLISFIIFVGSRYISSSSLLSGRRVEGFRDGDSSTGGSSQNKVATVKFFFANWCKYCQKAKPQYEAVKNSMNGQTIKGTKIQFEEIDCTDPTPQTEALLDQYYVKEYPTIKLVVGNEVFTFEEQVTSSNLQSFIQSHL